MRETEIAPTAYQCRVAAACQSLSMIRLRHSVVHGRCHVAGHNAVLGLPVTAGNTLSCHENCYTLGDSASRHDDADAAVAGNPCAASLAITQDKSG